jgi:hypothetical protein
MDCQRECAFTGTKGQAETAIMVVCQWPDAGNWAVVGTHFYPFPSLGTVVKKGEGWQWQPIEPAAAETGPRQVWAQLTTPE